MSKARVIVVSPNLFLREGIRRFLDDTTYEVVADAAAVCRLLPTFGPTLFDLLIWSPGTADDLETEVVHARTLLSPPQSARLVALLDTDDASVVCRVAALGVDAILSHAIPIEVFSRMLDIVLMGQQVFPAVVAQTAAAQASAEAAGAPQSASVPPAVVPISVVPASVIPVSVIPVSAVSDVGLTEREVQILNCLVNGSSNKTIARQLLVTEPTVKAHVKGLLRKIRVSNRTQAAIWALSQARSAALPALPHPAGP